MGWFGDDRAASEKIQADLHQRQQAGHAHSREMNADENYRVWFKENQNHKANEFQAAMDYARATGGVPQYRSPAEVPDLPRWFEPVAPPPPPERTTWFGFAPMTVLIAGFFAVAVVIGIISSIAPVIAKALSVLVPLTVIAVAGYFVWRWVQRSKGASEPYGDTHPFDAAEPVVSFTAKGAPVSSDEPDVLGSRNETFRVTRPTDD